MMQIRSQVSIGMLVVLFLIVGHSSEAQMKGRMTLADILATLKPGQWVELEGTVQPDLSILCTEVKLLTGDLLDDDWEITGAIRKVDKEKQEIEILRLPIKIQQETEFKDKAGKLKSFANLQGDMFVQAEGTYLKNGTVLAKQIEDKAEKLAGKHRKNEIDARGKVESIDPTKRTITLMGMTFQLTDTTKGKSAIK